MEINYLAGGLAQTKACLWAFGVDSTKLTTPFWRDIDKRLGGAVQRSIGDVEFSGQPKSRLVIDTRGDLPAKRLALLGMGRERQWSADAWVHFAAAAVRIGDAHSAKHVVLIVPQASFGSRLEPDDAIFALLGRGASLGQYRFTKYLTKPSKSLTVRQVSIAVLYENGTVRKASPSRLASVKAALQRGQTIASSVAIARDFVNEPALELYPAKFAEQAARLGRTSGLTARILKPAELSKRHMRLLLAVGQGSAHEPRLVHLSYVPKRRVASQRSTKQARVQRPIVLVGKGITFDSGGLCIKTATGMAEMKVDMAGAASVLAAMLAVAKLKPQVPVHGVLALAENMISGEALRPGDIVKSALGKTVEINNTDAEGRLILADALHYAASLKPQAIVDVATLTGACVVALGPNAAGLFGNDEALALEMGRCAEKSGETVWRMPLFHDLSDQLRSDIADLKNAGDRSGGAITAALFLNEFVQASTPWVHLDIAGPATSRAEQGAFAKGATGFSVATLVDFVCGRGSSISRS